MKIDKGNIILTSTGLSSDPVLTYFKKLLKKFKLNSVAIITTAADEKENHRYSQLAKSQFKELNFSKVEFIDLETEPTLSFLDYDVIYVCGGNTFKLLKSIRTSDFKETVINLLNRNGVYIGVSAGAIVLTPTIKIAATLDPDINEVGITNLTGLGIVDFEVLPHYTPDYDQDLIEYIKKTKKQVLTISNSQAVAVNSFGIKLIC